MADASLPIAEQRRRDAQNRLWGLIRFSDPVPTEVAIAEVKELLDQGARLELLNENAGDEAISPLHMAARGGDTRWLPVFEAVSADLTVRDAKERSIADEAALWGCDAFLMALHEGGLDVVAHRTGTLNCSLLHTACMQGRLSTVDLLLSLKCDANASNDYDARPMHGAHGNPSVMASLLAAGAEVSPLNRDFVTPIGMAVSTSAAAGFAFLLENGADPDSLSGGVSIRKRAAENPALRDILRSHEASQAARAALIELSGRVSP